VFQIIKIIRDASGASDDYPQATLRCIPRLTLAPWHYFIPGGSHLDGAIVGPGLLNEQFQSLNRLSGSSEDTDSQMTTVKDR
jgi:hypothetical protein